MISSFSYEHTAHLKIKIMVSNFAHQISMHGAFSVFVDLAHGMHIQSGHALVLFPNMHYCFQTCSTRAITG